MTGRMKPSSDSRAAMRPVAAILLSTWLAACSTTQTLDVPKAAQREEPINSLALEQCVRENGPQGCVDQGN